MLTGKISNISMSEYPIIAFTALLMLAYGSFSKRAEASVITAPMVFTLVGILVSLVPNELLHEGPKAPYVKVLAEVTLMIVLFVDASTINLKKLLEARNLPTRLLLIGLPITMIMGVLIAIPLFPGVDLWMLLLMALILSPTDAALGQAVVTSDLVPEKIRQTINVESGLNDGIALPPILICIAVLSETSGEETGVSYWLVFILKQFIYGPVIGGLVGWLGGRLVDVTAKRHWMNHKFQRIASISLAILAYASAESLHGNGFIAAFFAGLLLGTRTTETRERVQEFGETGSHALVLFVFLLFGMLMVPRAIPNWDWRAVVYALLSLTVIRMIPVILSLKGTGLPPSTVRFIGWFGPRGIASVLYSLMVVLQLGIEGYERILSVITLTVLLSIFLHGITAVPLSRQFQDRKGQPEN